MNRRSMLSFLGIGAFGASTLGAKSGMSYGLDNAAKEVYNIPMLEDRAITLKRMQDDLFGQTSDPAKWVADRLAEELKDYRMGYSVVRYDSIDPDIRNMKSITEVAKMRMYFERKVKRQAEVHQTSLTHRIAEYVGITG
jgi:hypothetical protein